MRFYNCTEDCLFGKGCETKLCMYKHEERDDDEEESENESDEHVDENQKTAEMDNFKPSLEKVRDAVGKSYNYFAKVKV